MSLSPTFGEMIRNGLEAGMRDIHVSLPGEVKSYDRNTQKASIQPLIKRGYIGEDGERSVERLPVITNVPVIFPGAGEISITWPVAEGSTGLLIFSSASLDKWLATGGEVDPLDDRHHTLSDAIFIPGLRPFSAPVGSTHGTAMVISAPLIHAGGSESLAFAEHQHLDSNGQLTSPPLTTVLPNPSYNPMQPNSPANPEFIAGASDPGTSVLKGA